MPANVVNVVHSQKWLKLVHNKNIALAANLNIAFSGVNN
jgi:hypothetical protein